MISHVWSYTFAVDIRPFFLQIHSKSWSGFIHLVSYIDIETYLCYINAISPIYIYISCIYIYICVCMVLYISPSRHRRFEQTRSKDSVAHSSEPHRHRRWIFRGVYVLHIYIYTLLYYIILYYIILCYVILCYSILYIYIKVLYIYIIY